MELLGEQFQGDIVELTANNHLTGSTVVLYVLATDGQFQGDIVELTAINHLTGSTVVL
jgi:hypothetical protein